MKKLFALLLAAFMLFSLAACGGEEETTAPAETTTEAPATEPVVVDGPVISPKGNVTIAASADWEYTGEYAADMLEFKGVAVSGASVYISDTENMEYEVQKKTVGYAYPDKEFEEVTIGSVTYECMSSDTVIYLVAPTSDGNAIYIQVRDCSLDDAKTLLENVEIK